jgi:hypothetical protein
VTLDCKKQEFRYITEVKTNAASIGTAIFADLVPHDIGFVSESPGLDNLEGL